MHFENDQLYHIYNQGNNKQQIFFSHENYIFFLRHYRRTVSPFADTIAYCLMPNHFHFLIHTNNDSIQKLKVGSLTLTQLSDGIRKCLSSYAAAINKQQHASGSLFRQKTKADTVAKSSADYARNIFHYIHQNPLRAKLVTDLSNWEYSSYKDYIGLRKGTLINKELAAEFIYVNWKHLEKETLESYQNKNPDFC